ncbi:MAG: hypothetical protein GY765_14090, partial [bacterium]|nr:hypothetical protein [bacterium]
MSNEFTDVFKEETYEILEEVEQALLELEAGPDDMDLVAKIFRAIHTIKGSGAMFGFDMISAFAHEIENAFDLIREGEIKATKNLIDLTLESMDFIKKYLEIDTLDEEGEVRKAKIISDLNVILISAGEEPQAEVEAPRQEEPGPIAKETPVPEPPAYESPEPPEPPEQPVATSPEPAEPPVTEKVKTARFVMEEPVDEPAPEPAPVSTPVETQIIPDETGDTTPPPQPEQPIHKEERGEETTYRISFKPRHDIMEKGTEVIRLLKEIFQLGDCHIIPYISGIPQLEDLEPHN